MSDANEQKRTSGQQARSVRITIAGQTYPISTEKTDEEITRVVSRIESAIDGLGKRARESASAAQLLAGASLVLAEELEDLTAAYAGMRKKMIERSQRGLQELDRIENRISKNFDMRAFDENE